MTAAADGAVCDRAKGFVEQMKPGTAKRDAAAMTQAFAAFDPEKTGYMTFTDFKSKILDDGTRGEDPSVEKDEVHSLSEY